MSDKLRVAWMVDRFYSRDGFCQFGIMEPNMLGKFLLCIRGAGNENRAMSWVPITAQTLRYNR
jgi:hypothetical protein